MPSLRGRSSLQAGFSQTCPDGATQIPQLKYRASSGNNPVIGAKNSRTEPSTAAYSVSFNVWHSDDSRLSRLRPTPAT